MTEHRCIPIVVILACLFHLRDASVIQELEDLKNWTSLADLSSELIDITDVESTIMSSEEDLTLALQLVAELMDGAVSTWSTDHRNNSLISSSFAVVNNLVDDEYSTIWSKLQSSSLVDCISFLEDVDNFGYNISKVLKQSTSTLPADIQLSNLEVVFTRLSIAELNRTIGFTDVEAKLKLSTDAIYSETDYIGVTSIGYKSFDSLLITSSKRLLNTNQYLSSQMVSYSVSPVSNVTFNDPVLIQINLTVDHRNWTCGSITDKHNDSMWSIEGCNASEEGHVITCSCDHLSTFAVLGCIQPEFPWQVKTALSMSIIVISLVFTVLVYANRLYFSDITILVLCILATLFLEQLFILTGTFTVCNRAACKAMALMIHFFDLSIFFWVFGQSVQIALKISYVTMESGGIMQYCALGWITPAFIVASSVGLVQEDYENYDQYCAVPQDSHASLGPIICVVVCNYICLVYIIYGYNYIRRSDNKSYSVIRTTKCNIAANGMIVTLMITSWSLWTSAVDKKTDAYYWLWSISVIFLGASMFLFYCVYNPEVKSEFRARFGNNSAVQDGSVVGRAARSQHQLNEAIRLSQIIENSVVREQDSVVGGVDCDQITNDSTISLAQTMTSSLAQRVGFRKTRLGPSTANAKSEGTTSNI